MIIPGRSHKDDLLVAVVSWGEECADPDFSGVNARISSVVDWIDATVCELSDYPPAEFCDYKYASKRHYPYLMLALFVAVSFLVHRLWKKRSLNFSKSVKQVESGYESSPEMDNLVGARAHHKHTFSYEAVELM